MSSSFLFFTSPFLAAKQDLFIYYETRTKVHEKDKKKKEKNTQENTDHRKHTKS